MKLTQYGQYRICNRCIMDTTDPDIEFDEHGVCNHCHHFDKQMNKANKLREKDPQILQHLVEEIKREGKGKPYDCIIGLSGGVDSSYVAWKVKTLGLRPLAVHLDNGWNSEVAVKNVENIVNTLNLDLFTIVIDWDEFRQLQLAYLRSSVIDLEVTSDHAIVATMYKLARKYRIKYIISGTNIATESVLPKSWYYKHKDDIKNLIDIYDKFGNSKPLKSYPKLSFFTSIFNNLILKIKWVPILNFLPYNKNMAIDTITEKLNWKNYGGKHHESIITKFYQTYILPQKTGFDKRRAHLSNLILSGQKTREEALIEIELPVYKSEKELEAEISYFIKKLQISREEFDEILQIPPKSHYEFKTDKNQRDLFFRILSIYRNLK